MRRGHYHSPRRDYVRVLGGRCYRLRVSPLLEIERLTIAFPSPEGTRVAVDGVDLELLPGSFTALVGESGCGKSLTVSSLIGLAPPAARVTAGTYRFNGEAIDLAKGTVALRGREIGFVFQDPLAALDPVVTVGAQLVETVRAHAAISRREARARALLLLQESGISDPDQRFDMVAHELSGGLRQRVTLALALAGDPKLLIADEATTALDPTLRLALIAHLRQLAHARNMAILFVTHDLGLVAHAAEFIAVMYCGRIVERGPSERVLSAPLHPYTRGLLASAPTLGASQARLSTITGVVPSLGAYPEGCRFSPRCSSATPECSAAMPPRLVEQSVVVECFHPAIGADFTASRGDASV